MQYQSQRDLSQQVPINYVTRPGISLTAACFGRNRYGDDAAQTCLSNLLAVGFRRLVVDLYWDAERKEWSLCPVSVPSSGPATQSPPPGTPTILSSTSAEPNTVPTPVASSSPAFSRSLVPRDSYALLGRDSLTSALIAGTSTKGTRIDTAEPTSSPAPPLPEGPYRQLGPYACTPTINLALLTSLLLDYLKMTENTLEAHIIYLILNIHAAASSSSPVAPAQALNASDLPGPSASLKSLFQQSLLNMLYTPSMLKADRADLNSSWYSVPVPRQPLTPYYTTNIDVDGVRSTSDGWPSESYIEGSHGMRLLVGFGSIDPQMYEYNSTADLEVIFSQGDLWSFTDLTTTSSGNVVSGCKSNSKSTDLSNLNASWATSGDISGFDYPTARTASLQPLLNLTTTLAACGLSPMINETIRDVTADTDVTAYWNIPYSAVWSWASGEPRNNSHPAFRCAALDPNLDGRWRVDDCSQRKIVACRSNRPLEWHLSTSSVPYSSADAACSDGTSFEVPRTGIENQYLLGKARDRSDMEEKSIWVNFNSIEVEACWVTGGPNATCPYYQSEMEIQRRTVLVPSIAALIVLVITALTLFVKCNSNRRNSKRKKRGEGGWDYEGYRLSYHCLFLISRADMWQSTFVISNPP
ncbi:MAG: hypothetical protein M1835_004932 [Candelina submexicana]|nr:MAG: hypothetical protein M1835_004932 [Candelina submexicana]